MRFFKPITNHPGMLLMVLAGVAIAWTMPSRTAQRLCAPLQTHCGVMLPAVQWTGFFPQMTSNEDIAVRIGDLAAIPGTGSAMVFLVTEDGQRQVPITIGLFEAEAIARAMQSVKPVRPMTHELLSDVIRALDAEIEQVTIRSFEDQIFKATLLLRTATGERIEIDARPSDSLSLAVHAGAALRVSRQVVDEAGVDMERSPPSPRRPAPQPERRLRPGTPTPDRRPDLLI